VIPKHELKSCLLAFVARAKYQAVLDVVQNLQAAGVDQLGLLTEQMQDVQNKKAATPAGD